MAANSNGAARWRGRAGGGHGQEWAQPGNEPLLLALENCFCRVSQPAEYCLQRGSARSRVPVKQAPPRARRADRRADERAWPAEVAWRSARLWFRSRSPSNSV